MSLTLGDGSISTLVTYERGALLTPWWREIHSCKASKVLDQFLGSLVGFWVGLMCDPYSSRRDFRSLMVEQVMLLTLNDLEVLFM